MDKLGDRLSYRGQTMFESTGSAYSNFVLRSWDPRISDAMIQAGVDAGYGSDRAEADAQRAFWGPALDPLSGRLWRGRPRFYVAQYGYARYHTLQTRPGGGLGGSRRRPAEGAFTDRQRILAGPTHPGVSRQPGQVVHGALRHGLGPDRRRAPQEPRRTLGEAGAIPPGHPLSPDRGARQLPGRGGQGSVAGSG